MSLLAHAAKYNMLIIARDKGRLPRAGTGAYLSKFAQRAGLTGGLRFDGVAGMLAMRGEMGLA